MVDEFYERYRQLSHAELFAMLTAGSPNQVDALVTSWKTMEGTASDIAGMLSTDLQKLHNGWESAAGQEFQRRVGLIAGYAQTLADEFAAIHTGLTTMSQALAEALPRAEHPDATDDHDKTLGGAAIGAAVGSLAGPAGTAIGGVVGGLFGHDADEEEKKRAHERMARLVAELAAQYVVADYSTWPDAAPAAPAGLPVGADGAPMGLTGLGASTVGATPGMGRASTAPTGRDPSLGSPGPVPAPDAGGPGSGGDADATDPYIGTGLAGVSPAALGGAAGAAVTAGGVLTGIGVAGLRRGKGDPASGSALSSGTPPGALGLGGAAGSDPRAVLAPRAVVGGAGHPPMAHRGTGVDDDTDEHSTWLTEDDIVWGEDEETAPAVIGRPEPEPEE